MVGAVRRSGALKDGGPRRNRSKRFINMTTGRGEGPTQRQEGGGGGGDGGAGEGCGVRDDTQTSWDKVLETFDVQQHPEEETLTEELELVNCLVAASLRREQRRAELHQRWRSASDRLVMNYSSHREVEYLNRDNAEKRSESSSPGSNLPSDRNKKYLQKKRRQLLARTRLWVLGKMAAGCIEAWITHL